MAKTREKKVVVSGVTADQMETAFADFARADARIQKINATMDVEMTRIREKYQDELSKLQDQKDKAFDVLQTIKGFTWPSVVNLLKEFLPEYVRTTEEAAKDRLLADREVEEVRELFPRVGITVVQDETFYVEPKKEEV